MVLTRIHKACKPIHRSDENLFRFGTGKRIIEYQFHRFVKKMKTPEIIRSFFPIRAFKKSQPKASGINSNFFDVTSFFPLRLLFSNFHCISKNYRENQ